MCVHTSHAIATVQLLMLRLALDARDADAGECASVSQGGLSDISGMACDEAVSWFCGFAAAVE